MPNLTIDIKTETIPSSILNNLVAGQIGDNAPYGRRLINAGQIGLLEHYNYVVWGAVAREDPTLWYDLGYVSVDFIKTHYPDPVIETPFGKRYPTPCLNIKHSELRNLQELQRIINEHN